MQLKAATDHLHLGMTTGIAQQVILHAHCIFAIKMLRTPNTYRLSYGQVDSLHTINVHLDKKTDVLISSVENLKDSLNEHMEVRLRFFAEHIVKSLSLGAVPPVHGETRLRSDGSTATASMSADEPTDDSQSHTAELSSAFEAASCGSSASEAEQRPRLTRADLATLQQTLENMRISPESITYAQKAPLGIGGFSKVSALCASKHFRSLLTSHHSNLQVYAVRCADGVIRAAKEVPLEGLSDAQLQTVYLRFSRELYILSSLKSDRIISVFGAVTTLSKLTLVMERAKKGSLRGVLDDFSEWGLFTPSDRKTVLQDVAEGIAYLHSR